jgi:hypothetical protein
MKFDAENQHAEAFKCRGFDGYVNVIGDGSIDGIIEGGSTTTKLGGLVQKGTQFAQSEKGKAAIEGAKTLFQVGKNIRKRRNPDEEVLEKCGKKPLVGKKKKEAWEKCRQQTLAARAAALAAESAGESGTPPDNSGSTPPDNSVDNSIIQGGTPNQNQGEQKSQRPMETDKTFDWKKNWWVLPLGLGVVYLGYLKFIKKQ